MTMNTKLTKFLLPLAALALGSVACDPFPAAPGGDPAIVRVVTYAGSLGTTNTVEDVQNGNTVFTDYAEPDSIIRIQFNKEMDGTSIQAFPQYNADGSAYVPPGGADPCTPADLLDVSDFPAGTLVCYDPGAATDGGSAVIYPGDLLVYGTTYTVAGSVRDYEGKSLTLNVSVTVDKRPIPFGVDGYTTGVDWFDSGTATTYDVLVSDAAGGPFLPLYTGLLPADVCDAGLCEVLHYELVPHTDYFFQVVEGTVPRPATQAPGSTFGALTPTLGVVSTTTVPPTIIPGIIRVAWGSTQGSDGYDVEMSDDGGATWVLYSHHTATARVVYLGTPAPGTTVPTAAGTLTTGTTYSVRVTPTFADLFQAEKGNVATKVCP
jgi:hypothetical protein